MAESIIALLKEISQDYKSALEIKNYDARTAEVSHIRQRLGDIIKTIKDSDKFSRDEFVKVRKYVNEEFDKDINFLPLRFVNEILHTEHERRDYRRRNLQL